MPKTPPYRNVKIFLSWTDRVTFKVLLFGLGQNCGVSTRKILEELQDRSVRIITNSPYDAPAEPLLKCLGWPSVNDMIYQESASMVYKNCK